MKRNIAMLVLLLAVSGVLLVNTSQRVLAAKAVRVIRVDVTDNGFEPAEVKLGAGQPATLIVTRRTDQTCAKEIVFASLNKRFALPLGKPVTIKLPASKAGTLSYTCGMNMLGGQVVIR